MHRVSTMNNSFLYSVDGAMATSGAHVCTGMSLSVFVCARSDALETLSYFF